ncbi:MAG: 30S ribosome-binding factor RbfA [Elusimicrobiota bacterium]|jgi:ribosome-binding factor A|nr:30S ribosome-binding factor RbfA [Elusimicrobiota bacterium]
MQSYKRAQRVGELIKETVANIVRDFDGLDAALVSITQVKLSDDLLNCKIYFSVFGDEETVKKNELILKDNIREVRHQIAVKLNLRRTPEIRFIYDDSNEKASKVLEIMERLKNEK